MSITAVGYAFQIGADSWVTFAIATVLWTLGELGTFPIAATTVANIAPKDVRGTYQGLYNLVWSLSNAFSPLVGGWILNAFGSHVLWTCCTVMFVIVAIGFYVTRGPANAPQPAILRWRNCSGCAAQVACGRYATELARQLNIT